LFFYCSVTITSVIAPCTLVRLVQFSKVFVALANYISISRTLLLVNNFF